MTKFQKKNKPMAPSFSLPEAIDKTRAIYKKEDKHTVPSASVADALNYTNPRSGSAITTIATIKMFGLLNSPRPGHLSIDQTFIDYEFSPNEELKNKILMQWVTSPKIFNEMLQQYQESMPSDATLNYELINLGFSGNKLKKFMEAFKASVSFSKYYEQNKQYIIENDDIKQPEMPNLATNNINETDKVSTSDRIPIRLPGGRRAWLELPDQFYEADKSILKNQIDIIVTDNENDVKEAI